MVEFLFLCVENIDIFVGDIFDLNQSILDKVDAIFNRGAIVTLPSEMRKNYRSLVINITDNILQLVITFDYNQKLIYELVWLLSPNNDKY